MSSPPVPTATADQRTEARLARLLQGDRGIVGELSLPEVLRRAATTARDVVGARYAALGVVGPDGLLEQFIHVGMDEKTVERLGELPKGRGLLGMLLEDPRSVRLSAVEDSPSSSGVPLHHPPMGAFLGVPIRSADAVYGNFYLAQDVGGRQFSAEDEELLLALAATVGVAIENARLYEQAARRSEWLRAAADVSQRLLQSEETVDGLSLVAESVRRLTPADIVSVVVRVPGRPDLLEVAAAAGHQADQLGGVQYPFADSLVGRVLDGERGMLVDAVDQQDLAVRFEGIAPVREVMVLALKGHGPALGALVVARTGRHPFRPDDLDLVGIFAEQATLALEREAAHRDRRRLDVVEDRARIARDLHDHVIQRLFAGGLTVQGVAAQVKDPGVRQQLTATVDALNTTIRCIRSFIAELEETAVPTRSARLAVVAAVAESAPLLGLDPSLTFRGPLDSVPYDQAVAVSEVVHDRLAQLVQDGGATAVRIELGIEGSWLSLVVVDDGPFPPGSDPADPGQTSARPLLTRSPQGGSLLSWRVPIAR